jgi:L-asparaginase
MSVRIIITGGTFDKHYDELKGVLTFRDSHLPEILEQVRVTVPVSLEINQLIDSLEMRDENRKLISDAVRKASERHILITHGTDKMVETARCLGPLGLEKTIVLTGAMIPYAFKGSDALFNFGCAFSAVQLLPSGVYIVMNGQTFAWDRVRKNYDRGVFEVQDE